MQVFGLFLVNNLEPLLDHILVIDLLAFERKQHFEVMFTSRVCDGGVSELLSVATSILRGPACLDGFLLA